MVGVLTCVVVCCDGWAGDGAKPAEEDSRFLHDEGWVEDFGGDKGLAGMITELKVRNKPACKTPDRCRWGLWMAGGWVG